jgi:hypothetical protein
MEAQWKLHMRVCAQTEHDIMHQCSQFKLHRPTTTLFFHSQVCLTCTQSIRHELVLGQDMPQLGVSCNRSGNDDGALYQPNGNGPFG